MSHAGTAHRIISLAQPEATRPELAGAKAASLASALQAGFPVPAGFVLTVGATVGVRSPGLPEPVRSALRRLIAEQGDGPWAVRSSGVTEDLPTASFAGQYSSHLDVTGADAVEAAAVACLQSARGARAESYRQVTGLDSDGMAVLIQRFVAADLSGVALGADPVTGERDVVVLSCQRGPGGGVGPGSEEPEEWKVCDGRDPQLLRGPGGILDPVQARTVAAMVRRLERVRQTPLDVEWAVIGADVLLLQARPMTALPGRVTWPTPTRGGWLRGLRLGEWLPEPVTPLCATWLLPALEERLRRCQQRDGGFLAPPPMYVLSNGWYFHSPIGAGHPTLLVQGLVLRPRQALATVLGTRFPGLTYRLIHARVASTWREEALPAYEAEVHAAAGEVELASGPRLVELVDSVAWAAGHCYWTSVLAGGAAWRAERRLALFHRRHLAGRVHRTHHALLRGLAPSAPQAHSVYSLDWFRPTLGEFSYVATGTDGSSGPAAGPSPDALRRDRIDAEAECLRALSRRRRRQFTRLLAAVRAWTVLRGEHTQRFTLGWPVMRQAVGRLGAQLTADGLLDEAGDVFFLTKSEVDAAVVDGGGAANLRLKGLVAARHAQWDAQRVLAPPPVLGRLPFLLSKIVLRTGGPASDGATDVDPDGVLRGTAASPGLAAGPVRTLADATDVEGVEDGEILVVTAAPPALVVCFHKIAGLCVSHGGVATHTALIAREYGLPMVVGLGEAGRQFRDGEIVVVDGTNGTVRRNAR